MIKEFSYIIVLLLLIASCKKSVDCCTNIDVGVDISYIDSTGMDLLDTTNAFSIPLDSMKLFYWENDTWVEVYDNQMDAPRNILFISESDPMRIRVFTSTKDENYDFETNGVKQGKSICLLRLNHLDSDTIETEWQSSHNGFVNTKIWYNGIEVGESKSITIIKK